MTIDEFHILIDNFMIECVFGSTIKIPVSSTKCNNFDGNHQFVPNFQIMLISYYFQHTAIKLLSRILFLQVTMLFFFISCVL
jgi:hypothetical protein